MNGIEKITARIDADTQAEITHFVTIPSSFFALVG